jgi:hypothetical protein
MDSTINLVIIVATLSTLTAAIWVVVEEYSYRRKNNRKLNK